MAFPVYNTQAKTTKKQKANIPAKKLTDSLSFKFYEVKVSNILNAPLCFYPLSWSSWHCHKKVGIERAMAQISESGFSGSAEQEYHSIQHCWYFDLLGKHAVLSSTLLYHI